jgi:hypothetical protein
MTEPKMPRMPWFLRARTGTYVGTLSAGMAIAIAIRAHENTLAGWQIGVLIALILLVRASAIVEGKGLS